jgi:hypothetical protein
MLVSEPVGNYLKHPLVRSESGVLAMPAGSNTRIAQLQNLRGCIRTLTPALVVKPSTVTSFLISVHHQCGMKCGAGRQVSIRQGPNMHHTGGGSQHLV